MERSPQVLVVTDEDEKERARGNHEGEVLTRRLRLHSQAAKSVTDVQDVERRIRGSPASGEKEERTNPSARESRRAGRGRHSLEFDRVEIDADYFSARKPRSRCLNPQSFDSTSYRKIKQRSQEEGRGGEGRLTKKRRTVLLTDV